MAEANHGSLFIHAQVGLESGTTRRGHIHLGPQDEKIFATCISQDDKTLGLGVRNDQSTRGNSEFVLEATDV
jgi:hypothetical protein